MAMISLKRSPSEDSTEGPAEKTSEEKDSYSTRLYLQTEEIDKLGLGKAEIGEERMMMCKVRVESRSESEREGGERYASLELCVLEAEIEPVKRDAAKTLFGGE